MDLDLPIYIAQYSGRLKIDRLIFIAKHSEQHRKESLTIAASEILKTLNVDKYLYIMDQLEMKPDFEWVKNTKSQSAGITTKLKSELTAQNSHLIKEFIRIGHIDLANHCVETGALNEGLSYLIKSKEFCATSMHLVEMYLLILQIHVELEQLTLLQGVVSKAQNLSCSDPNFTNKLNYFCALSHLYLGNWSECATALLSIDFSYCSSFSDLASPSDILALIVLTSLASKTIPELGALLTNPTFKPFLDLDPTYFNLLVHFQSCKFANALEAIYTLKPLLLLNIHFFPILPSLITSIQSNALIFHVSPYSTLNLVSLSTSFNLPLKNLIELLMNLILNKKINAKIDSVDNILYHYHDHQGDIGYDTLETIQSYHNDIRHLLLKCRLQNVKWNEIESHK